MKRKILALLLAALPSAFAYSQGIYGCTPDLHVEGNQLTDPNGNPVVLHGVMDTPSMWFNSDRWTSWDLGGYVPAATPRAREYFTKIFDAITDVDQGAYCDLFRLHMEPSWVRKDGDAGNAPGGESNLATTYDRDKVKLYLEELFVPIAEDANAHGLYVIMRPPGVCPEDIQVGDAYQKYLLDVWDIVSKNEKVKQYAGWLSLELANEPVRVKNADGSRPTDGAWGRLIVRQRRTSSNLSSTRFVPTASQVSSGCQARVINRLTRVMRNIRFATTIMVSQSMSIQAGMATMTIRPIRKRSSLTSKSRCQG